MTTFEQVLSRCFSVVLGSPFGWFWGCRCRVLGLPLVSRVARPGVPALPRPFKGDVKLPPVGVADYRRYHPAGEQPPVVQGHGPTTAATTPKGSSHPSAKGTPDFCRSRRSVEGAAWRPSVGAVAAAESLDLASDKSHGYPGGTLDANGGIGVTWAVPPMVGVKGSWDVADGVIIERMYGDCQGGFCRLGGGSTGSPRTGWRGQGWYGIRVSGFRPSPE